MKLFRSLKNSYYNRVSEKDVLVFHTNDMSQIEGNQSYVLSVAEHLNAEPSAYYFSDVLKENTPKIKNNVKNLSDIKKTYEALK